MKELFTRYIDASGIGADKFAGVSENHLVELEMLFDASITVFNMKADGSCDVVWRSKRPGSVKLNPNIHGDHFSYIRDADKFCKSFRCQVCDTHFSRATNAKRHICNVARVTDMKYSTGIFKPPSSVWDMVEMETGIKVPHSHKFYPYWMTYDIESLLLAKDLLPATNTTTFHSQHQLVSV